MKKKRVPLVFFLCAPCVWRLLPSLQSVKCEMLLYWAGSRSTFIAVGGLVMLSTRRSMNEHRVLAWHAPSRIRMGLSLCSQRFNEVLQEYVNIFVYIKTHTANKKTFGQHAGFSVCLLLCVCVFKLKERSVKKERGGWWWGWGTWLVMGKKIKSTLVGQEDWRWHKATWLPVADVCVSECIPCRLCSKVTDSAATAQHAKPHWRKQRKNCLKRRTDTNGSIKLTHWCFFCLFVLIKTTLAFLKLKGFLCKLSFTNKTGTKILF